MEAEQKVKKLLNSIRFRRLERGFFQDFVGEQLGISQYAYHKIEIGKTKLSLLRFFELCVVFETTPQKLFDDFV